MNTNRDRRDEAIDHVAARLTRVDDDPTLAPRIVAALPERVSWRGWSFAAWVPRLAMIAIAMMAGLMWARRDMPIAPVDPSPLAAAAPFVPPTVIAPAVVAANPEPVRTQPLEPLEPVEPLEPSRGDFERSLVAVATPEPLDVQSLAPHALPAGASIEIAPLAIVGLPLTEEFPKFE